MGRLFPADTCQPDFWMVFSHSPRKGLQFYLPGKFLVLLCIFDGWDTTH